MLFDVDYRSGIGGMAIYVPISPDPRPAILLLHGSEGGFAGWSHVQALALAHKGFIAVPWSYCKDGSPWHAGDIRGISLDDTEKALAWLQTMDGASGRVGLYGQSRGAEHALVLTSLLVGDGSPHLPRAVAVHGATDVIVGAFIAAKGLRSVANVRLAKLGPWEGTPIDLAPEHAWQWRGTSELLSPGSSIEIERYAGPLFLSHGEEDDVWSVKRTRRLERRLIEAGRSPEVHYYPAEAHRLRPETRRVHQAHLVSFFERHLAFDA
jgi:dipeptidyl aminopeptidase/acylaminoacyl peptidase